eukprot:7000050-Prymnesium_polylepis.2
MSSQLGFPPTGSTSVASPTPVGLPIGVRASEIVAAASHTLLLASNGAVYAFGDGTHGRLGHGDEEGRVRPTRRRRGLRR